jgi:predicted RNase H-like nuclease (RuvC/YqgF family)
LKGILLIGMISMFDIIAVATASQGQDLFDSLSLLKVFSGGAVVAIINALSKRRTEKASAGNIEASTQTMLSELIDTAAASFRKAIEDQDRLIEKQRQKLEELENIIGALKKELDGSVLRQRLIGAEQDNVYLRGRVRVLLARIDDLASENKALSKVDIPPEV